MTRGFIIGLFVGLFVGMVGALLLAPTEGAKTRGKVLDVAYIARNRVGGAATKVRHKTRDVIRQSI
ncbi:MAG: YtxH domain-containing protein [Armatimonadota bacterium]|nr:YtxH domain-containing protein [bacterium]